MINNFPDWNIFTINLIIEKQKTQKNTPTGALI